MRRLGRLLDQIESRWSLWQLVGGSIMGFGVPAWATYATDWLAAWGPIVWVACGFAGLFLFLLFAWALVRLGDAYAAAKIRRKLYSLGDPINPMDSHFLNKRIFLQSFIPPAGYVEGKTFERCEIIGPLNIIPYSCDIRNCTYVTTDYIMVTVDAVKNSTIRNGQAFWNCRFIDCKFFYVSILVNEGDWKAFDAWGGCNWITPTPKDDVPLPLLGRPANAANP